MPKYRHVIGHVYLLKGRGFPNLACLVLSNFVLGVFFTIFAFAICASGLGDVDLGKTTLLAPGNSKEDPIEAAVGVFSNAKTAFPTLFSDWVWNPMMRTL